MRTGPEVGRVPAADSTGGAAGGAAWAGSSGITAQPRPPKVAIVRADAPERADARAQAAAPVRDEASVPLRDATTPGGGLPATKALQAALNLVCAHEDERGRLDALDPFRRELRARAGEEFPKAWQAAAEAAPGPPPTPIGSPRPRGPTARRGAPGYGHPDAGAVSLALILTAAGETLGRAPPPGRTRRAPPRAGHDEGPRT
ncbi:hypothetical protein ACTPOK_13475 [Streptomyces inhibens]|uniref:hypothetical protein n=1 Tax=Streptomyces inhibens TaxID=2293571 RepID=UPI00402AD10F